MRRTSAHAGILAALLAGLVACASASPGRRAEAEAAVRSASKAVAEAEANMDADAVMPYWTESSAGLSSCLGAVARRG
jgi:hypothetical protein